MGEHRVHPGLVAGGEVGADRPRVLAHTDMDGHVELAGERDELRRGPPGSG